MPQNKNIKAVLKRLIGNQNILTNNVLFIDYCDGNHSKAQFLSQLYYWASRAKRKDGYFAKSHLEWFEEIRVKRHSVIRYTKELSEQGLLKTKVIKFKAFPTTHYWLNIDLLIESIVTFCNKPMLHDATNVCNKLQQTEVCNKLQQTNNIDYTENTNIDYRFASETKPQKDFFEKKKGLKKQIGSKQYDLLNEVCTDKKYFQLISNFVVDGRFDSLIDWLEYKHTEKKIKSYSASKGLKILITRFSDYTPYEVKQGVNTAISNQTQGVYFKAISDTRRGGKVRNLEGINIKRRSTN